MLKIKSSLLCGLMLLAGAGCQTAHSVKETIVNWRPSFHKGEKTELLAETLPAEKETESPDDKLKALQVKTASLKQAAEQFEVPELEQIVEQEQEVQVAEVEKKLTAFEEYQRSLEEKELEANQLVVEAEKTIEESSSEAKMLIQGQIEETASEVANVDPAFVDSEKLSEEIDALLSVNEPEDNLVEEMPQEAVEQDAESVQQAVLADQPEAGDIAFDLASFADSSISDSKSLSNLGEENTELVAEKVIDQAEYPWAAGAEKQEEKAENQSAETPENKQITKAVVQPRQIPVSEEILHNLERALGDENWRAAGRTSVRLETGNAPPQSNEFKQVAKLIYNQNAKVRLQGLRLAVQNGNRNPEVVSLIETLLNDDDQIVKAHAASSLNQWKQSPEKVIAALAEVLASENENARQFAAMYMGDMTAEKNQIIPILETHLLSAQGMTALHLSEALLKLDSANVNAVSRLTSLMRDKNVEIRWLSAHALGSVQGELQPYAVEALRGGLRDVDSQVRSTSALALGGLGNASQVAVAELNFMLEHGETNVKDAAKIALDCIQ